MSAHAASVIVTTYNRPEALRLVLQGLAAQSRNDFEVIVADDGSGDATRDTIERLMPRFDGRLRHVWQEDRGFRVAAARNRALETARGEIVCFLDGDCVPRTGFVASHLGCTHPNRVLRGARVLLSRHLSESCERDQAAAPHAWTKRELRELAAQGDLNRTSPLRGGTLDRVRRLLGMSQSRDWRLLRGCNFSAPMQAVREVQGFDESFEGWGFEDSEFCIRLLNRGMHIMRGPAETCVLHLWHRENDRQFEGENLRRLEQTRTSRRTLPARGMRRSEPRA